MERIRRMRKLGSLLFVLMWLPFTCIFVGMAGEMGGVGADFADAVSEFIPGLLEIQPSGASTLTMVSFILTFGVMLAAMALIFGAPLLAGLQNRKILRSGRAAPARILSVTQTGTYINQNPVVRFTLEVQPADGMPFEAEAERLVYQTQIPQFQPGSAVPVRYDPETLEVAISDELTD